MWFLWLFKRTLNPVLRNWNFLQSKERLALIFNKPPLVAYRRPKSLRDRLVSTKFRNGTTDNALIPRGCKPCQRPKCSWCNKINETKTFKSTSNNKIFTIFHSLDCQSSWVIYIIECNTCRLQYIGKSEVQKKKIYIYIYIYIYIVYVIESAAYGVICTSCLCQKPERARYERVGLLTQTTSEFNPVQSTFYDVSCLLHITREFSLK